MVLRHIFLNILFHIISWNDLKSLYIFYIVQLKNWEQEPDKRKTQNPNGAYMRVFEVHALFKSLSLGAQEACQCAG